MPLILLFFRIYTMVQSCVVIGCTNRWEKGNKLSWHRFPSEESFPERRKRWLDAIRRKAWTPSEQDRVCGKHFISGISIIIKMIYSFEVTCHTNVDIV